MKHPEPPKPWHPVELDAFTASSVKAMVRGEASEQQQKRVVHWLLFDVCRINDISYRADSQRDTDFAEGKRFVGQQVVTATKVTPATPERTNERAKRGASRT